MIRMVPTPKLDSNFNINSDLDPNHSLEQVIHNIDTTFTDFDLSFLPKTEGDCNLDVDLGSPASSLVELSSLSPPSPVCLHFSLFVCLLILIPRVFCYNVKKIIIIIKLFYVFVTKIT